MPAFDADRDAVCQRARAAGVHALVIPGVEPAHWDRTRALAHPGERFIALGIHPQVVPDLDDAIITNALDALARDARDAGAVAIGECGLDGTIDLARAPCARQRAVVAAHVEVARALDLPLIVHVLHAHAEALALFRALTLPRAPGVIHSFSGSAELAHQYLALGFHLSFSGAVTRPNARRPVAAARAVPRERLLIETDAPDQTPTGAPPSGPTGRRCEPAHLPLVAARLAEIRGEPLEHLVAATTANARALFRLPPAGA
jgi:TatD DNase family protein